MYPARASGEMPAISAWFLARHRSRYPEMTWSRVSNLGRPRIERSTERESNLLLAMHDVSGTSRQSGQAPPRFVHSEPVPHCVVRVETSRCINARPELRHIAERLPRSIVVPFR